MSFSFKKGEFDRFFNRLDRPVEESRPDRQPDRFPSLVWIVSPIPNVTHEPSILALRDLLHKIPYSYPQ